MTGDRPGVTRKSQLFEISADPLVYVMDTPGVMPALSDDAHPGLIAGLRFALVGGFRDDLVGIDLLVEFLIHKSHSHLPLTPGQTYCEAARQRYLRPLPLLLLFLLAGG